MHFKKQTMDIGMGVCKHSEKWCNHSMLSKTKALSYNGKRFKKKTGMSISLRDAQ